MKVDQNSTQALQMAQMQALAAKQDASLGATSAAGKGAEATRAEIKKAAEEFESLFLGIVLKSMRDTVGKSGLIDGGNAEDIYRSMLDTEYAKQMAAQRHTGIADNIEDFLLEGTGLKTPPKLPATASAADVKQPSEPKDSQESLVGPPKSLAIKAYEATGLRQPGKQATIGLGTVDPKRFR